MEQKLDDKKQGTASEPTQNDQPVDLAYEYMKPGYDPFSPEKVRRTQAYIAEQLRTGHIRYLDEKPVSIKKSHADIDQLMNKLRAEEAA